MLHRSTIVTQAIIRLTLVFCIINLTQLSTGKNKPVSLTWLKFQPDIIDSWDINIDNNDPGLMFINPRWTKTDSTIKKNVFMLVPKKSGSYQLAIIEFLHIMQRNNIATDITLIHFNKDSKRGRSALDQAETEQADLIFSMGSESASLIDRYFRGKAIPVVTSTNKDPVLLGMVPDYHSGSGTNIAFTSLNIPIDVQMNYLQVLRPKLKTVGLLYNKNHKQVMKTEVAPLKQRFKELGLNIIDIAVSSRADAKQELTERMPNAIKEMQNIDTELQNSLLWITSSTAAFTQIATINKFSGNVPVLGAIPNIVKEGADSAVLAIGIDRRNNAHLASIYAVKILKKQSRVDELEVGVVTPPDIAINFHVAKKIGLKIPFQFFESASFIYDYQGKPARLFGQKVQ